MYLHEFVLELLSISQVPPPSALVQTATIACSVSQIITYHIVTYQGEPLLTPYTPLLPPSLLHWGGGRGLRIGKG